MTSTLRTRPDPSSISDLLVPNLRYHYLAGADRLPFDAAAGAFHLRNAWWMAEMSFLAYVKTRRFIARALLRAGFSDVRFHEESGTSAFIAEAKTFAVVVFRGTDVTETQNLLADVRFLFVAEPGAGRVHRGFRRALDAVWPRLARALDRLPQGLPVWFTGHSLGAALAVLAARRHGRARGVCTFGAPRVGDEAFRESVTPRPWRIVNDGDLVTFLPPPLGYRHVGQPYVLLNDGRLSRAASSWERLKDRFQSRVAEPPHGGGRFWRPLLSRMLLGNALSDHAPIHYAVRLWNLCVAEARTSP